MDTTERAAGRTGRRWPMLVAAAVVVAVVATGAVAWGVAGSSEELSSDGSTTTSKRPATSSTTTSSTTSTTVPPTTAVPTTLPPTTTAPPPPPTVAAATTTPAPVVAPAPPPRRPIRLLVAGDSLGFTAAFPPPSRAELPGFIASVSPAAMIGCGVLAATGHTAIDESGEGAGAFDCGEQTRAELEGLSARPDWMVFFSGAWEHLAWRASDGRVLAAGSPELRSTLLFELVRRASVAASSGTRTAFVAWVCPHGVAPNRTGAYALWYNALLREAAAAVPGAYVVEPTDRVCVNADAGGAPTAEKLAAFRDHHPTDRAWLWKTWLGPDINGRT